jgi:hypothetical protein
MRQATLILVMVLVGCATDDLPEQAEEESEVAPTHDPDNCPGGGGGGADPHPIPAPKDCTQEASHELCLDCCDWNVENVWGERCRRLPNRDRRDRDERRQCWQDAERRRSDCQRECPIITVAPWP